MFHAVPSGVINERSYVPRLQANYQDFRKTLAYLIQNWLNGDVGSGAPDKNCDKEIIIRVNNEVNWPRPHTTNLSDDTTNKYTSVIEDALIPVYQSLIDIKILSHLRLVTSHRKWVQLTYQFFVKAGVTFSKRMPDLIQHHDLSKYTHHEVIGYAIMFQDGQLDQKQLQSDEDKLEWQISLANHYAYNPHHPEYFYQCLQDGTRNKSRSILDIDSENGTDYLDESVLDMLASRGERELASDAELSINKWMDIADRYMSRYSDKDREFVLKRLNDWKHIATEYLSQRGNFQRVQGHFFGTKLML